MSASLVPLAPSTHLAVRAQERTPQAAPSAQSAVTAVLVDVVVRDRQGRPVTDLSADDFELYEDDVRQTLGAFTRVARSGGIGLAVGVRDPGTTTFVTPSGTPSSAAPPAEPDPAVTALVFDALSPDALAVCQQAALTVLPKSGATDARVGVFVTEPAVRSLQRYTEDPALVRRAVQRVTATGTIAREQQRERLDALNQRRKELDARGQSADVVVGSGTGPQASAAGSVGAVEVERRLLEAEANMQRAFEQLDRDHRGLGTANALLAVVQSLANLPGRKSLVFFSQGLPASPAMQGHLQSVIDTANRINVTLYAVDASGLRAVSSASESQKQLEEVGDQRLRQLGTNDRYLDRPITQLVERTEDMMRFDPQGGLTRLAEDTGGFLVRDTNDVRGAFRRIDEDMRFHYLLSYSPLDQRFDGRFRTIGVKVRREGLRVTARKGYRALRLAPGVPVLTYEAPALAALDAERLPNAFPFTSAAFSFPDPKRAGLSPLIVRVKTDTLTYRQDATENLYAAEAVIVVRVTDAGGRMAHKTSQEYQLSGKLEELDGAKRGEILFYREPELEPGVYSVEAVVFDAVGKRASARISTLEVPKPASDDAIQVSSLVLVNSTERVGVGGGPSRATAPKEPNSGSQQKPDAGGRSGATRDARHGDRDRDGGAERGGADDTHPLYVRDLLLYPNAGEPVHKRAQRELPFFFNVYAGSAARAAAVRAELELLASGRLLARLPVELSPPDARHRIQQVSRLPLAALAPGTYELRLLVHDGARTLERSTFFRVVD